MGRIYRLSRVLEEVGEKISTSNKAMLFSQVECPLLALLHWYLLRLAWRNSVWHNSTQYVLHYDQIQPNVHGVFIATRPTILGCHLYVTQTPKHRRASRWWYTCCMVCGFFCQCCGVFVCFQFWFSWLTKWRHWLVNRCLAVWQHDVTFLDQPRLLWTPA